MSDAPPVPQPIALDREKQRAVDLVCEHYARDHLTESELERRLDGIHGAASVPALRELIADLPELAEAPLPAPRLEGARAEHQLLAAVMGGMERNGDWVPPKRITVAALMGGACLDFREAHLPPGVTEVRVFAMWGGVEILVAPGVRVEVNGIAVMGGFSGGGSASGATSTGEEAPVLRIGGAVLMAGVDVQVRYPGEGAEDAARRRKKEWKQLRSG